MRNISKWQVNKCTFLKDRPCVTRFFDTLAFVLKYVQIYGVVPARCVLHRPARLFQFSGFRWVVLCCVSVTDIYGSTVSVSAPTRCARTGSRKICLRKGLKSCHTLARTHSLARAHTGVYRLLIKCAAGGWYVNLRSTAVLCFTMWRKQSLPAECCSPGEVSDCAIIVSLSRETKLGKAHTSSFLLQSLWQLLLKQSPPQRSWQPVGGALFHRTWVWCPAVGAVRVHIECMPGE